MMPAPPTVRGACTVMMWVAPLAVCVAARGQAQAQVVDLRSAQLPRWDLTEDLRIGSVEGTGDALSAPGPVRVAPGGAIYVVDRPRGVADLKMFDPDGRFVRQIGARGEGPGEYLSPASFGISGDTLWISDSGTGRLTYYTLDGILIESFPFGPQVAGRPTQLVLKLLGPDQFLVLSPTGPDLWNLDVGPVRFAQSVLRSNRTGTAVDTMVTYRAEFPMIVTRASGRGIFNYLPIRDGPLVGYSERTDIVREVHRQAASDGASAEFRILERTRGGNTVRERTFRYQPVRMPTSVRDSMLAEARRRLARAPADLARTAMRYLYLPEFQPPVSSMVEATGGTTDGTFWIEREQYPPGPRQMLVLDRNLAPIATVDFPARAARKAAPIAGDHIWFVETDDMDVPYLVRYRIVRGD